jgi:PPOX class probable F420-dependent enzyme
MDEREAWERLRQSRHGVLGTVHRTRGPDLVPVVYAVDEAHRVLVPIDAVKPKTTARLQRLVNLEADPRCALLVDHFDEDWTRLWWVRASGVGRTAAPAELARAHELLASRYPQYRPPDSIAAALLIERITVTGWRAGRDGT